MDTTRKVTRLGILVLVLLVVATAAASQPFVGPGPISLTASAAGLPDNMMIVLEPSVGGKPSKVLYYGPADDSALMAQYGVATTYTLGKDYDGTNYTGSILTWTTTVPTPCNGEYEFRAATYPSGWDNRVSSARAYGGLGWVCNHFVHYENTYYGGAKLDCGGGSCKTMGVMNNASSSAKIYK